jgi:hypothetical protein
MNEIEIQLIDRPDGLGFFRGTARRGDAVVHVNILPPEHLWAGCIMLEEHRPDPTHWQVFADGELVGRIEREEDVGAALVPLLSER